MGAGCHFLLQGIFLTQGSNSRPLRLLHWQGYSLHHLGSPNHLPMWSGCSVMSNSLQPHGPTTLLLPWGFPGKSTGVGCFPCGSAGKESACNVGELGSIPGLGRSSGEGKGYPLQYYGLENFMDYIGHRVAKSQTQLSNFRLPTAVLKIQPGPTQRPVAPLAAGGRLPTWPWALSKSLDGASFHGEWSKELWNRKPASSPLPQSGLFYSFFHFPFLLLLHGETFQLCASFTRSSPLRPTDLVSRKVPALYLPLSPLGSEPQ